MSRTPHRHPEVPPPTKGSGHAHHHQQQGTAQQSPDRQR